MNKYIVGWSAFWIFALIGSFVATIRLNSPAEFQLVLATFSIFCLFAWALLKSDMFFISMIILIVLLWNLAFGVQDCMFPPIRKPTPEKLAYVKRECDKYLWWWVNYLGIKE